MQLVDQHKNKADPLPSGITIKKTQFLTMMDNYKNAVLTAVVAPTDREAVRAGLKKAVKWFGKVLGVLLPCVPNNYDGLRCIRAYVSRISVHFDRFVSRLLPTSMVHAVRKLIRSRLLQKCSHI
jgi:hypothetical protein